MISLFDLGNVLCQMPFLTQPKVFIQTWEWHKSTQLQKETSQNNSYESIEETCALLTDILLSAQTPSTFAQNITPCMLNHSSLSCMNSSSPTDSQIRGSIISVLHRKRFTCIESSLLKDLLDRTWLQKRSIMIPAVTLNTGAEMPVVGLGTWRVRPNIFYFNLFANVLRITCIVFVFVFYCKCKQISKLEKKRN